MVFHIFRRRTTMKHGFSPGDGIGSALEYVDLKGSERKKLPAGWQRGDLADGDHITTVTVQVCSRAKPGELDAAFKWMARCTNWTSTRPQSASRADRR
jgi:hypothetical protein